jgi:hypothetical protein
VELVVEEEPIEHKMGFREKEAVRTMELEAGDVATLGNDKRAKGEAEAPLEYKGEEAYME